MLWLHRTVRAGKWERAIALPERQTHCVISVRVQVFTHKIDGTASVFDIHGGLVVVPLSGPTLQEPRPLQSSVASPMLPNFLPGMPHPYNMEGGYQPAPASMMPGVPGVDVPWLPHAVPYPPGTDSHLQSAYRKTSSKRVLVTGGTALRRSLKNAQARLFSE